MVKNKIASAPHQNHVLSILLVLDGISFSRNKKLWWNFHGTGRVEENPDEILVLGFLPIQKRLGRQYVDQLKKPSNDLWIHLPKGLFLDRRHHLGPPITFCYESKPNIRLKLPNTFGVQKGYSSNWSSNWSFARFFGGLGHCSRSHSYMTAWAGSSQNSDLNFSAVW